MTPEERNSVKEGYLKLIDLIIKARKYAVFGKTGLTSINKEDIDNIVDLKLNTSLEALLKDGIIQEIKIGNRKVLYKEENIDGVRYITVDCLKKWEEMTIYKDSLMVEFGILSISMTPFKTLDEISHYTIQRKGKTETQTLNDKEGKLLAYLQEGKNINNSRKKIAEDLDIDNVRNISTMKNSIKSKMRRIGYSKKEVNEIIPAYTRGKK